ncbi:MAG: helix-hairpin-helix domain-containing protein [Bacteroidota bacterium]
MILFSICDIPWWLLWLLPLLLALLLWWYWRNKYDNMVDEYKGKIKGLNNTISSLEEELAACKTKRSELEGDLALTKGRMREMEAEMQDLKAKGGSTLGDMATAAGLGALATSLTDTSDEAPEAPEVAATAPVASIYAGIKPDNLQIIEGIGPKMESVLKENGIDTLVILGGKSEAEIQTILDKYGDKYKIIDPKTWASQAQLAGDGKFAELIDYQKKLDTGKDNAVGMTDSKLEKYLIKIGALKAFKQDDLKAIEGIGPATDKLLQENGITTWRELANTSVERLKQILTDAGSRFGLSDPTTWPQQAQLAADGKFDELREYQDFLDGGKA